MSPDANDLVRALARRLIPFPSLTLAISDDAPAIRLFVDVAHCGRCPGCGGRRWRPSGDHELECPRCGRLSVFRGSALERRKVSVQHLLAAVFAIFVDTSATSARAFSRRNQLRLGTSWRLLHDVREALPRATPQEAGLHAPDLLGRCAASNAAGVLLAGDDGRLVAVETGRGSPPGRGRTELPLWLGRLRAWLTDVFRGVSAKHLWRYLAEFAARHGRVARRGESHI